jgi:Phage tail assembly chaperone protein
MQIRIRASGAVMYEDEFRRLNPNTSFPQQISEDTLNDFGADVVFEGPQASGGTVYQYSQTAGVEQISGKWYTKHILGPVFTDAEQEAAYKAQKDADQAKSVRTTRNDKLMECDWTQITDATADKTAWATYRTALRDISGQAEFPWTIIWPTQPE